MHVTIEPRCNTYYLFYVCVSSQSYRRFPLLAEVSKYSSVLGVASHYVTMNNMPVYHLITQYLSNNWEMYGLVKCWKMITKSNICPRSVRTKTCSYTHDVPTYMKNNQLQYTQILYIYTKYNPQIHKNVFSIFTVMYYLNLYLIW